MCINWAVNKDWDRIKGYAKEHGPEVLLGVYTKHVDEKWDVTSVLAIASTYQNVGIAKLTLEAGFDNNEAMFIAASNSMSSSDNSTILRLLLEHGLDKRIII
jgi:glycerol dehydrogenase-like iron-containing ADH family enzyme